MSAAGREMGLSPAVVSKRVSQLEDRLGARLFQRTTRHLTLTETGAGYFKRVVDILSLCEEAEDFVSRRNTKPRGHLKVTIPASFGRRHIAPHISSFLARYPDIELDVRLTEDFVDIIRDGYDLAIRIGELEDSSLVARKIARETRVICAAPAYLERHGVPVSLADLERHNCLSAGAQDTWQIEGPEGLRDLRPNGNVRSDSGDFIHAALCAGVGLGLRSVWEVGPELKSGALKVVLPQYRGSSKVAIHAVFPCREFMPAKVNVLIEFLASLYGPEPYWESGLDLDRLFAGRRPPPKPSLRASKRAKSPSGAVLNVR
jgi:DNA-binding transcriptional LysR family regulator